MTFLEAAARGYAMFVVDMTRTRFCASAGIGALVRAHKRAQAEGGELRLLMPTSAAVQSVFALTVRADNPVHGADQESCPPSVRP